MREAPLYTEHELSMAKDLAYINMLLVADNSIDDATAKEIGDKVRSIANLFGGRQFLALVNAMTLKVASAYVESVKNNKQEETDNEQNGNGEA